MATAGRSAGERERRAAWPRSHLFAVRLWQEETDGGAEYRGSVRDVVGGAYRNFRAWADLAAFLVARMEEAEDAPAEASAGGLHDDGPRDG